MGTDETLREEVQREYARLAGAYDLRWRRYVAESTGRALRELGLRPHQALLDVGCGTGVLLARALRREPTLRACGADLSAAMLAVARKRLGPRAALVRADAEALPFRSAAFDAVASSSAMHYWPDPARALREMARVLRPGGRLVLVDWCADSLRTRALSWILRATGRPVARVFRAAGLEETLSACGFRGIRVDRFRAGGWGLLAATARRAP